MGIQITVRRVVRVDVQEEKVRDLEGETLAPKSVKKVRVC